MPFVSLKEAINSMPKDKPCAIGAFNYHNIEYAQAIVDGAEAENTPVILMVNEAVAKYMGVEIMATVAKLIASKASVPVAVMIDHGKDVATLEEAIDYGISVMFDGSDLPMDENIAITAKIAKIAHAKGVSVEGEIGCLGQSEDGDEEYEEKFTTSAQALEFIEKTGVDVLAVAVGNAHGFYTGEQRIDVERIAQIKAAVGDTPIVMHGGSDMDTDIVRDAIHAGINKFNIATDLKVAYTSKMKEILADELPMAPLKVFDPVKKAIQKVTQEKIRLFSLK